MAARRHRETAGAGPALFRVVRFWAKRWALRAATETTETAGEQRRTHAVMVLEAVDAAAQRDEQVSVADVAYQLGIDQSGASRFVTATIDDGYLRRTASAADRRRAALVITRAGRTLLADAHAWQEQVFADLTAHWDPADAARFAGYLQRLSRELVSS